MDPKSKERVKGEERKDENENPPGMIAAIVLGGILALILVCCSFFYLYRRKSKDRGSQGISEAIRVDSLPIRVNGIDSTHIFSDTIGPVDDHCTSKSSIIKFFFGQTIKEPEDPTNPRLKKYSFKQLEKATKNFSTIIGKGAFGPVFKAEIGRKRYIAVKLLANDSKQGDKEFKTEVMILGRLHHRNLSNLSGYCVDGGNRLLAYEFMSNGNLSTWLHDKKHKPLSWNQRVSIAQDVARGIEYLHDGAVPPVIHRDIKAGNILLDSSMIARVSDFGFSKEVDTDMLPSAVRGSYGYVDPEYIRSNTLTEKSDVYSFGVVLFELITGRSPQQCLMDYVQHALMCNEGIVAWLEILDPRLRCECDPKELEEMALIASKCAERNPCKRPRMRTVAKALAKLGPKSEGFRMDFTKLPSWVRNAVKVEDNTDLYGPSPYKDPRNLEGRG